MHSRLRPSPALVIALIALFVSLGGTAAALSGSNTVFTDDITDNQVYSADVRNDTLAGGGLAAADLRPASVGTSEVAADSLGAADLAPSSVGTSEAADNSLTGTDIVESSLGQVPTAGAAGFALDADALDGLDSTDYARLVGAGAYAQLPIIVGSAPDGTDCDEGSEAGRVVVRTDGGTNLYICKGTDGWVGQSL